MFVCEACRIFCCCWKNAYEACHRRLFLKYIFEKIKPNFLAVSGINLNTSGKIFERISEIKTFSHFYVLNPLIKKIISKNLKFSKEKKFSKISFNLKLEIKNNISKLPKYNNYPKKSLIFFKKKIPRKPIL